MQRFSSLWIVVDDNEDEDDDESDLKKLYPETFKTKERRLLRGNRSIRSANRKQLKVDQQFKTDLIFFSQQTLIQIVTMKRKTIMTTVQWTMTSKKYDNSIFFKSLSR